MTQNIFQEFWVNLLVFCKKSIYNYFNILYKNTTILKKNDNKFQ